MLLQTRRTLLLRSLCKTQQAISGGSSNCGTSLAGSPPSLSTTLPPQGSVPTYLPLHFCSPGSFPPRLEVEESGIVLPSAGLPYCFCCCCCCCRRCYCCRRRALSSPRSAARWARSSPQPQPQPRRLAGFLI